MITLYDTCRNCGTGIELVPTTWAVDGGAVRTKPGITRSWMHIEGGARCPEGTPGLVPLAEPCPRCPDCGSTRYATAQEAWCDVSTCGQCGRRDVRMIGD